MKLCHLSLDEVAAHGLRLTSVWASFSSLRATMESPRLPFLIILLLTLLQVWKTVLKNLPTEWFQYLYSPQALKVENNKAQVTVTQDEGEPGATVNINVINVYEGMCKQLIK